ncbi:TonB family protein [Bacteroides ilei]|uniref:TonB family protein n=1 Tax=Bacteroides ilei TaxID=1907658 RepID=UPI000931D58E|nr:TonB family protein [Bacteroides ilei]
MKKSKIAGIVGTVLLHVLVLVLLLVLTLTRPEKQEEGGVPVMLGNMEMASGDADPYMMTEVDVMPATASEPESEITGTDVEQPMITQNDEPSIQMKKEQPRKETVKKENFQKEEKKRESVPVKTETEKPKEKTEAELRAEAERAAAQAAASKVAGAFGKGTRMGSKGNASSGEGIQGSPTGNSNTGKTSGIGGLGTFDLNGRSLGPGGLPMPVYNVQDEGRVVVTIVVDPSGRVISTSINKRTNTVNPSLRKAALDAAAKARFNSISGVNNQSGTITYYFKLK